MNPTETNKLPLYSFFCEWQKIDGQVNRQAVDSKTYMVLVEALNQGIGLSNEADLLALCKALLFKPYHDANQFKECFERHITIVSRVEEVVVDPVINTGNKPPVNKSTESLPLEDKSNVSSTTIQTDVTKPTGSVGSANDTVNVNFQFATTDENGGLTVGLPDNPDWEKEALRLPYRLNEAYMPIGSRLIRQSIRSLRLTDIEQQQLQPDLRATIERVARRGYYDGPVWRPTYAHHIPLVLVLDQRGSMVPFHGFCNELVAALKQQQPDASVYYVYNCPTTHLFRTPSLTDPLTLWEWKQKHQDDFVLVFSDAGAARGHFSDSRVRLTKRFLDVIRPMQMAWLNPMPRPRWSGSSAESIAQWVAMFTTLDEEFVNIFRLLKGKIRTGL